jgi:hypothetical protein
VLEDRRGALVVGAAQEHLAQEREAGLVRAVDLDDPQQLGLGLFPLVQRREGLREDQAAFVVVGVVAEPGGGLIDRLAWTAEGQEGLGIVHERRRRRIAAEDRGKLVELLGGRAGSFGHPGGSTLPRSRRPN